MKKKPLEVETPTLSTPSQMQGKAGANSTFSKGKPNSSKIPPQKQDSTQTPQNPPMLPFMRE